MLFRSDNITAVCPEVMAAIIAVNEGDAAPYGADEVTRGLDAVFSAYLDAEAEVHPVATGIAANSLALAAALPPWGAAVCHRNAHIQTSECGAPEFFSGGAKLIPMPGPDGKLRAADVEALLGTIPRERMQSAQPTVVSMTQGTEAGTVYRLDEIRALAEVAHARGLALHMDGARFSNALVVLGCTPAEMTWKAGVDILSYGATKNGAMCADAVVVFKASPHHDRLAAFMGHRRLRAGQVFSKMRYVSAQLRAMVSGGVAERNARHANAMAARLSRGLAALPGARLEYPTEINEVFCRVSEGAVAALAKAGIGLRPRPGEGGLQRLVTAWNTRESDVDRFIAAAAAGSA
ncbi:MAG: low specificity L-threonine aldolase [Alphaproteobacteria bacterium]|nr:low specificity L-threonine aldolase [Alphaproteobacteria bacterium]